MPQHLVGELHPPLRLGDHRRLRGDLEIVVVGLSLPKDRKGQPAPPPGLVLDDLCAAVGKNLAVFGRHFLGVLVVQVGRDQSDDVIEPHSLLLLDVNPGSSEPGEDGFRFASLIAASIPSVSHSRSASTARSMLSSKSFFSPRPNGSRT